VFLQSRKGVLQMFMWLVLSAIATIVAQSLFSLHRAEPLLNWMSNVDRFKQEFNRCNREKVRLQVHYESARERQAESEEHYEHDPPIESIFAKERMQKEIVQARGDFERALDEELSARRRLMEVVHSLPFVALRPRDKRVAARLIAAVTAQIEASVVYPPRPWQCCE
jgi:hypothetical protein